MTNSLHRPEEQAAERVCCVLFSGIVEKIVWHLGFSFSDAKGKWPCIM